MHSDYEIQAHVAYRMDVAREIRRATAVERDQRKREDTVARRPPWSRRIPRFIHRPACAQR